MTTKQVIQIAPSSEIFLGANFLTNDNYNYAIETDTHEAMIVRGGHRQENDVEVNYSLGRVSEDYVQGSEEGSSPYKTLRIYPAAFRKDGNDKLMKDYLEKTKIKMVPTVFVKMEMMRGSFREGVKTLTEAYQNMEHKEDVKVNFQGEPVFVLRPTNGTHSILAFQIDDIELFREITFHTILKQLEHLWNLRKNYHQATRLEENTRDMMFDCGISPISETTFGMDGVYRSKTDDLDNNTWALSLFIKGSNKRALKVVDDIYIHDAWEGQSMITAKKIEGLVGEVPANDFKVAMDNPVTPISGSMDLRINPEGRVYYIETSPSFSIECYSSKFIIDGAKKVLNHLIEKHKKMIGTYNQNLHNDFAEWVKAQEEPAESLSEAD